MYFMSRGSTCDFGLLNDAWESESTRKCASHVKLVISSTHRDAIYL